MKIFSPPPSNVSNEKAPVKKNGKGKKAPPLKPEISENEIREKVAANVATSNTAKAEVIKKNNAQALGAGFMAPTENESSLEKSHLLLSDVKLNDPNDSNTQEKLKTVLKNGAFNFNPREKETLEKILADT